MRSKNWWLLVSNRKPFVLSLSKDWSARALVVSFAGLRLERLSTNGNFVPLSSKNPLPDKITRRTIAADQHIALRVAGNPATYLGRIAPDNLRVMANILPLAGGAHIRKHAVPEKLLFIDPAVHHLFERKRARRSRPQIFALIGP